MMNEKRIGFIGAGNMSTAIISGLLNNGYQSNLIFIYDIDESKVSAFNGCNASGSISELANSSEIIFLCVKPQNFEDVLPQIKVKDNAKIFVSIAAGISTDYIRATIGENAKVIRTMPNTPLLLGEGATAICRTSNISDEEFSIVFNIFSILGKACELNEEKMNAIVAVNGSSPAYIYLFADAIIKGAIEQGIDGETAKTLFCQTLIGSAKMLLTSEKTPNELIKMVASPGGTTLKALEVFNNSNFSNIIIEAMNACTKRAAELGK
jgi:pyrroline-5-carboxylate reductase